MDDAKWFYFWKMFGKQKNFKYSHIYWPTFQLSILTRIYFSNFNFGVSAHIRKLLIFIFIYQITLEQFKLLRHASNIKITSPSHRDWIFWNYRTFLIHSGLSWLLAYQPGPGQNNICHSSLNVYIVLLNTFLIFKSIKQFIR